MTNSDFVVLSTPRKIVRAIVIPVMSISGYWLDVESLPSQIFLSHQDKRTYTNTREHKGEQQ